MNAIFHDLLCKLRIISKLKVNQKLDTTNGLNIYTEGWVSWMYRKINRDNKDEGVRFLDELYKSFAQCIKSLIQEMHGSHHSDNMAPDKILIIAAFELRRSIEGLDNLIKTYRDYPATVAKLEGLVKDYIIITYCDILRALPKHPAKLDEEINFQGVNLLNQDPDVKTPRDQADF
jgi:hypothetical protein